MKRVKIKIQDISEKTKLSRQYVSKILHKKITNPGIKTLRSISEAIGCKLEDLGYWGKYGRKRITKI